MVKRNFLDPMQIKAY